METTSYFTTEAPVRNEYKETDVDISYNEYQSILTNCKSIKIKNLRPRVNSTKRV
ncbi:hypothetical protein [Elizabethkingia meningoseptica]|uniref:hypothetical protein n=1 Tax=Elizabethkingia meningoseptica TaxID=238 RepID=UPI001624C78F|nr:hypothetical protein [Elizabethkingia meningoseptica]HAY3553778.1 hypothetical protein [Elizabethkingia meningoseptica]